MAEAFQGLDAGQGVVASAGCYQPDFALAWHLAGLIENTEDLMVCAPDLYGPSRLEILHLREDVDVANAVQMNHRRHLIRFLPNLSPT